MWIKMDTHAPKQDQVFNLICLYKRSKLYQCPKWRLPNEQISNAPSSSQKKKHRTVSKRKVYLQSFVDNIASALHQNVDLSCAEPPINYAGTNMYD
jgi:hypothetical protein